METLRNILNFELAVTDNFVITVYNILIFFIILLTASFFLKLLKRIFHKQEQNGRIEIGKSRTILQILRYVIWILAITASLHNIGFKITFILAGSAALLVGLGLALQQIFQDFMCGITLIIEGTIKVGDIIEAKDGDVSIVKEIGLRTSLLETRDSIIHIVPNSKLINEQVINWSHHEKRTRFSVSVGVAYGSDIELVTKTLLKCAEEHPKIAKVPLPNVLFSNFGNSSLDFQLLFYTTETFRVEYIKSDLRYKIDAAFRKNNITIPFPQRDVHFYGEK